MDQGVQEGGGESFGNDAVKSRNRMDWSLRTLYGSRKSYCDTA